MIVEDTARALGLFAASPLGYSEDPSPAYFLPRLCLPETIPVERFRVLDLPPQEEKGELQIEESGCAHFG